MEPIISKLQEGVKYPRFERDATTIINDLVEHITKERGVYSSNIEPNPNEHNIWFNTDTNTLKIYNEHVWRDFSGSGSSSGWSLKNIQINSLNENSLKIDNIKDKTFYILDVDIDKISYIEIPDLSDNIEFYIFISSMPERLYFPNSNIITNYDTIVRHTTGNNIVGMSVLAHKVGITVEFSIINDKTDASNKNYVYNTKAESALLPFIGKDNNMHYITKDAIVNENNLNQIEAVLPSNVEHNGYINGTLCVNGHTQIVYSPFHLPIDDILEMPETVVFKNVTASDTYNPLTIRSSLEYLSQNNLLFKVPHYAIFDKFNIGNDNKKCTTRYPQFINNDSAAIIIKDNWEIYGLYGLQKINEKGFDVIIDNFLIYTSYNSFNSGISIANIIINNGNITKTVLYRLSADTCNYKPNENSILEVSSVCDKSCTIIFTTTCKTNDIYIPINRDNYDNPLFIILPYKTNNFKILTWKNLKECGNTVIVTIPDNYDIINNYSDHHTEGKPLSEIDNIHINTTLEIVSTYDEEGLLLEEYYYEYDGETIEAYFDRIDTPLIG